jgi:hypothetical protein
LGCGAVGSSEGIREKYMGGGEDDRKGLGYSGIVLRFLVWASPGFWISSFEIRNLEVFHFQTAQKCRSFGIRP